jgi:hypothetical protein
MMTQEDQDYEFNSYYDHKIGMFDALDPQAEAESDASCAEEEWRQLNPAERFVRISQFERTMLKYASTASYGADVPF